MSSSSKTKKKHLKRIKNAIARSQTVFYTRRGGVVEEADYLYQNGDLYPVRMPATPNDVIKLHDPRDGGDLSIICSCGWSFGPDPSNMELGRQGIAHSNETGHVLRSHD